MLAVKTNGAGFGVIEHTVTAETPQGEKIEAMRLFICYDDGRTVRFNTTGNELREAIARGDIKLYGRMMAR